MVQSGMERLLGSFGLNPQEIRVSIEQFMLTMQAAAEKINANQQRLEAGLARMERKLTYIQDLIEQPGETTIIADKDGKHSGALLTTEKFPQAMLDDAGINVEG